MKREGTWRAVTSTRLSDSSAAAAIEAWESKDDKALGTISLLVEDLQISHIRDKNTAKDAWEALQLYYEKASGINKFTLIVELLQLKFLDGDNLEIHIGKIQELTDNLTALGNKSALEFGPWIILRSMPESYHTLISVLVSRPEAELTIDVVKATLLSKHKRRKSLGIIEDNESAMRINISKSNVECFFCHKSGHYRADCPQYSEWRKRKNFRQKRERARMVLDNSEPNDDDSTSEIELQHAYIATDEVSKSSWYLDSAASSHMSDDVHFSKI